MEDVGVVSSTHHLGSLQAPLIRYKKGEDDGLLLGYVILFNVPFLEVVR